MIHLIVSPEAWTDNGELNIVVAAINGPKELAHVPDVVDLEILGTGIQHLSRVKNREGAASYKDVVKLRWDGQSLTGIDGPVTEAIRQRISIMQTAVMEWRTHNKRIGEQMVKNSEAAMNETAVCSKCKGNKQPFYHVAEDEQLCGECLGIEHERALAVQSAYVNWLKHQAQETDALRLLRCLKLPAEAALKDEPKLHEAGTPTGNVKVVWHTSYHTLHELLDVIGEEP